MNLDLNMFYFGKFETAGHWSTGPMYAPESNAMVSHPPTLQELKNRVDGHPDHHYFWLRELELTAQSEAHLTMFLCERESHTFHVDCRELELVWRRCSPMHYSG